MLTFTYIGVALQAVATGMFLDGLPQMLTPLGLGGAGAADVQAGLRKTLRAVLDVQVGVGTGVKNEPPHRGAISFSILSELQRCSLFHAGPYPAAGCDRRAGSDRASPIPAAGTGQRGCRRVERRGECLLMDRRCNSTHAPNAATPACHCLFCLPLVITTMNCVVAGIQLTLHSRRRAPGGQPRDGPRACTF